MSGKALRLFLVAGEHSGDILGGKLIGALKELSGVSIVFGGVGGEAMEAQGMRSLFPLSDVAVMGPFAILKRLPSIVRRVYQTVDAASLFRPDAVVIIDSPEFTHPIAKRIRRRHPEIPIIDYVSPSVWAWRPGRARKMKPYVDLVLGLLPFEPDAHTRLGGPRCVYVGHPLIEDRQWIRDRNGVELAQRLGIDGTRPVLVVLPGSRRSEAEKLMGPFGEALRSLVNMGRTFDVVMPTVAWVRPLVEERLKEWPVQPHLIEGREDMFSAFRLGRAALAASGTVTLELAAAELPMVVAYRVDPVMAVVIRRLATAHSAVLANLILGENVFPEYMQEDCTGENLALALAELLDDGPARDQQTAGLARIAQLMDVEGGRPSIAAAREVLNLIEHRPQK